MWAILSRNDRNGNWSWVWGSLHPPDCLWEYQAWHRSEPRSSSPFVAWNSVQVLWKRFRSEMTLGMLKSLPMGFHVKQLFQGEAVGEQGRGSSASVPTHAGNSREPVLGACASFYMLWCSRVYGIGERGLLLSQANTWPSPKMCEKILWFAFYV